MLSLKGWKRMGVKNGRISRRSKDGRDVWGIMRRWFLSEGYGSCESEKKT